MTSARSYNNYDNRHVLLERKINLIFLRNPADVLSWKKKDTFILTYFW